MPPCLVLRRSPDTATFYHSERAQLERVRALMVVLIAIAREQLLGVYCPPCGDNIRRRSLRAVNLVGEHG